MDDLISREALKKAIAVARTNYNTCPEYNELFKYFSEVVSAMIDEMPAVDAEPVRHGTWELVPVGVNGHVTAYHGCSACGCVFKTPSHYCPNCGAKMEEE